MAEKQRIGGRRENRQHISPQEKKRSVIIKVLIGVLIAIAAIIIITLIPKGKKNNDVVDTTRQARRVEENIVTNEIKEDDSVKRNKNKVYISVNQDTLTEDGAVITIQDSNAKPYVWTPRYKIQEKIDDEWEDVELKNPENNIFADTELENPDGIMTQSLVWVNKYGKLERGKQYRIVKESDGIEFYAEFKLP